MRAVVLKDGAVTVDNRYPQPEPGPGEALIRVRLAGICATDLELVAGYRDFSGVLGHEFVGVVEAVRDADAQWLGRRVVGEINIGCGDCDLCRQGLRNHCRKRLVLGIHGRDGAFADYCTLPVANLHQVPDSLSDREAVFTEPVAAAFAVLDRVRIGSGEPVLVLGDGRLGLLIAQVLKDAGAVVTLAGRHAEKLALAEAWGIATTPAAALGREKRFPVVVEATGSAEGLETALNQVRPRGTVVLKSTVAGAASLNLTPAVVDEVAVVGSRCGPFAPALAALDQGAVAVSPLIESVYPLVRATEAFRHAGSRGALKILLEIEG